MSKKTGFFILAGVGIGLVSGLSPVKVYADDVVSDVKNDIKAADAKLEAAESKLTKDMKTAKPSARSFHIPSCKADAITLKVDQADADFRGMSHDGASLTLINTGATRCAVPGRLDLTFLTKGKHRLPVALKTPRGFNPGPVVRPVFLVHDGKAKTKLRWVSQKVFDKNVCYKPAFLAVKIQGEEVRVPFKAHICGDKTVGALYEASWLHPVAAGKTSAK